MKASENHECTAFHSIMVTLLQVVTSTYQKRDSAAQLEAISNHVGCWGSTVHHFGRTRWNGGESELQDIRILTLGLPRINSSAFSLCAAVPLMYTIRSPLDLLRAFSLATRTSAPEVFCRRDIEDGTRLRPSG